MRMIAARASGRARGRLRGARAPSTGCGMADEHRVADGGGRRRAAAIARTRSRDVDERVRRVGAADERQDAARREPEQRQQRAIAGSVDDARPQDRPPQAVDRGDDALAVELAAAVRRDRRRAGRLSERGAAGAAPGRPRRGSRCESAGRRPRARPAATARVPSTLAVEELALAHRRDDAGQVHDRVDAAKRVGQRRGRRTAAATGTDLVAARRRARAVTWRPMKPLAPVTATRISVRSRRPALLVDPVRLVARRAGHFRRLVDVAVVLEHPRELRAPVRPAPHLAMELEEQQRIEAERSVRRRRRRAAAGASGRRSARGTAGGAGRAEAAGRWCP